MNSPWHQTPSEKQLRQFGWTVGAALLLLGGIFYWRHPERHLETYLWWVGGFLVVAGSFVARILRLPFQLWMGFAYVLGLMSTAVILSATFLLAFAPVALLLRFARRDPLELEWAPGSHESYWHDHETLAVDKRYLRQF